MRWGGGVALDDIGAVLATSMYTTVTSGGANTKGAFTQLIASTAANYVGFVLYLRGNTSAAKYSVDIAFGAGGSEVIMLPDVRFEGQIDMMAVFFPIPIPSGTRVSASLASTTATTNGFIGLLAIADGPEIPDGYQRATTYGFTAASTSGIQVDAGAAANTKGAWTEIVASTTYPIRLLYFNQTSAVVLGSANTLCMSDIGVGSAGNEAVIVPNLPQRNQNAGVSNLLMHGPIPVDIPAGSRLSARCQADTTNANGRIVNASLIGLG